MPGFSIRRYAPADLDEVLALAEAFGSFDGGITEADLAVSGYYKDGLWVAVDQSNAVVGFAFGYPRSDIFDEFSSGNSCDVGYVSNLAVRSDFRNLGIGTALLKELIEAFKKQGVKTVALDCPATAREARSLYEKFGFEASSTRMKKHLTAEMKD